MSTPPATRDLLVIGASAGGIQAITGLLQRLPADLPAAVLVVLHIPPQSPSLLHRVLGRATPLRVVVPADGDSLQHGTVYVPPSDRHLMVSGRSVRITRGPRQCRSRPAIDVLFRSAATEYGPRVVGVILSGTLDDGTAGLWAVKDKGGVALVQDPQEAGFDAMPLSAIEHVQADLVGGLDALAAHIVQSIGAPLPSLAHALSHADADVDSQPAASGGHATENLIAEEGNGLQAGVMKLGKVSQYTCPDCHGVLVQIEEGTIVRFRCHTGHAFSLQTLIAEVNESIDSALWDTLRAVEERILLLRQMGDIARAASKPDDAERCHAQARETEARLKPIRDLVMDPAFFGHSQST